MIYVVILVWMLGGYLLSYESERESHLMVLPTFCLWAIFCLILGLIVLGIIRIP